MDIGLLKEATISKVEGRQMSIDRLWEMDAKELGNLEIICSLTKKNYMLILFIFIQHFDA